MAGALAARTSAAAPLTTAALLDRVLVFLADLILISPGWVVPVVFMTVLLSVVRPAGA
jgi:hypothetical protein